MNPLRRAWHSVKAAAIRFAAQSQWMFVSLGGTRRNFVSDAGDGSTNAIVCACVRWACRTFPEAPMIIAQRNRKGALDPLPDHRLVQLLDNPNPFYSGLQLWAATIADFMLSGNAYWVLERDGTGRPVRLWWLPSTIMEPKWDSDTEFISRYEQRVNGEVRNWIPADVVHFRDGFDPANVRKGMSPIAALAREVVTDNEAANWTASLVTNQAVPGVVISPEVGTQATRDQLEDSKQRFMERFGGDRRGEPLMLSKPTKVTVLGFSPEQMQTRELRRIPEERITAAFGIPAIVVGLGAGLDRSTYSNMAEAREAAYESFLIPLQRLLASEVQRQLVPEFGDPAALRVYFDLGEVRVLQADENALHERARGDLTAGLLTLNQALTMIGEEGIGTSGEVRFVPNTITPTDAKDLIPEEPEPVPLRLLPGQPGAEEPAPEDEAGLAEPGKGLRRKADDPMAHARDRLVPLLAAETETLFADIAAELGRALGAAPKAIRTPTVDDVLPLAPLIVRLRAFFGPWYRRALTDIHVVAQRLVGSTYDLEERAVRRYLTEAGSEIGGIAEQTRAGVARALAEGHAAGEAPALVAARVMAASEFGSARALTIAQTELAQAANRAALESYAASGKVSRVRVTDGHYDAACAAMDGRTFTLEEAQGLPRLEHPNCRRVFHPESEPGKQAGRNGHAAPIDYRQLAAALGALRLEAGPVLSDDGFLR